MRPDWESGGIRLSVWRRNGRPAADVFKVYHIKIFDCFPGKTAIYFFYLSVVYQYFFYVVSGFPLSVTDIQMGSRPGQISDSARSSSM